MELNKQVLSIEQVQELIELGFDVEKYASMAYFEQSPFIPIKQPKKYELEILTDSLIGNRGSLEVIPTLTIGDIIDILPKKIKKDDLTYIFHIEYSHNSISIYYDVERGIGTYFFIKTNELIYGLFETLKWCIKNKHI